jgi:hypothetical protein
MSYTEYKEVEVPKEVQEKLMQLQQLSSPDQPATLSASGFFDWLNKLSKDEGWTAVWQGFNFPYIVLERQVAEE